METERPKAVVLHSGGLDSTVLLYSVAREGYEPHPLSIHYGQQHERELAFAKEVHLHLGIPPQNRHTMMIPALQGSVLTDKGSKVPEGHYTAENMAQTVVPNRNAILLALAYSLASRIGARMVATAVHAGDHAIYPDCRPIFIEAFEVMETLALDSKIYKTPPPRLYAPFVNWTKARIVDFAYVELPAIEFGLTWSCYVGEEFHCGRCGTCVERIEAFQVAGVPDPTEYVDKDYAKEVIRKEKGLV